MNQHSRQRLKSWQRWSLLAAGAGAGVCAAIVWEDLDRLWPAYLYAYFTSWLVCMGGMGLLALGNLTGGRWAAAARPFYLAATQTTPLLALLFIPIGALAQYIYPWVDVTAGTYPEGKEAYLDIVFFCSRGTLYYVVWMLLALWLSSVSRVDRPPASTPGMRRAGAMTLVLLVPTSTFAAFDWGMSLEPEWYSSIYGALASAGGVVAVHALTIIGLAGVGDAAVDAVLRRASHDYVPTMYDALQGREMIADDTTHRPATSGSPNAAPISDRFADLFNDLGNLLLAFLMMNTYFALSQFLIIWSANLPSEVTWYVRRFHQGWQWLALTLAVLHFLVPFLMLLSRDLTRVPRRLARIALLLLVMYFAHVYWMIAPALTYSIGQPSAHVLNIAALAAMFGGWLAAFFWLTSRALTADSLSFRTDDSPY